MELVIVEGRYPEPTTAAGVLERDLAQRWCFDVYRSHPVTHFLSPDGSRICCVFQAPDAESVRRALDKLAVLPPERVWTASLHAPADENGEPVAMAGLRDRVGAAAAQAAVVLVTRSFAEPVTFDSVQAQEDAGAWCLRVNDVRFLGSFFARDRQRMVCLYVAPDAEAVRRANSRVGLPFEDVWSSLVLAPDLPDVA